MAKHKEHTSWGVARLSSVPRVRIYATKRSVEPNHVAGEANRVVTQFSGRELAEITQGAHLDTTDDRRKERNTLGMVIMAELQERKEPVSVESVKNVLVWEKPMASGSRFEVTLRPSPPQQGR